MNSILYKAAREAKTHDLIQYKHQLLNETTFPAKHTVLHVIAQHNDSADAIRAILWDLDSSKLESLLTCQNTAGETALYIAARNRRKQIVQQLITSAQAHSPSRDGVVSLASRMARLVNVNGDTPLHEAVNNKDEAIVRLLVNADPDHKHLANKMGKTPLYIALEKRVNDDSSLRRFLSQFDDSINLISSYDATLAAIFDVCKSPGIEGPDGETILHAATRRKETSKWISQICYRFPEIKTKQDMKGFSPLHNAAHYNNPSAVKVLLDAAQSMTYITAAEDKHESMTPLHIAASKGHTEVIEEILEHCEDCWDAITSKGQNILHLAAKGQHTESISLIVKRPWAINLLNMKDDDGNTPLHLLLSSMPNDYETIKPLLEVPEVYADVLNKQHSTPLELFKKAEIQFSAKKVTILDKLENKFGRVEKIPWMTNDGVNGNSNNEVKKTKSLDEMRKTAETQLVVAALIATVTFAAGFTLPGGYDNDGPNQGAAVLIKKGAFGAFVVADTIAFISSFAAIFLHFTATLYKCDEEKISKRYKTALLFLIIAMISMVISFVTGLYVVLEKSPAMAITLAIIGCLGIPFLLFLIRKVHRDMGVKFMFDQYFFASIIFVVPLMLVYVMSRIIDISEKKVRGISRSIISRSVKKMNTHPRTESSLELLSIPHHHRNV